MPFVGLSREVIDDSSKCTRGGRAADAAVCSANEAKVSKEHTCVGM